MQFSLKKLIVNLATNFFNDYFLYIQKLQYLKKKKKRKKPHQTCAIY